jgi:hypothetical protein
VADGDDTLVTNQASDEFNTPLTDIGSVYAGGSLMKIDPKDLVGNEIAIRQLINNHNDQCMRRIDAERRLSDKDSEIEFLKTTPFMTVFSLIASGCGAAVGGIGINLATGQTPPPYSSYLVWLGYGLIFLGGVANTLYPLSRRWFNPPSSDATTRR